MAKPVILALDDDPSVLNAVERDLRQMYGRDYRVLKARSGREALDALTQLQARSEIPALFVVDQRMPEMSGVEFLEKAIVLFPDSRRVLLTAYADTEAAIQAINKVGLDYYLMKPWDPPAENLYPVLDDLLAEWRANVHPTFEGLRVAGALWSPESHALKDFLVRNQIPYLWMDVDADVQARALAESANQGVARLPTVFFPDGSTLVDPPIVEVAQRIGMQTRAALPFYDLIIVGSGPAGLAAAVYATSEGMRVLLIEKKAPGGQAGSSPRIDNYLGFPSGISGRELARRAAAQAKRFGAELLSAQEAKKVEVREPYRVVTLGDGSEVSSHTVLLAMGASFHTLKSPGAAELTGKGIYYGAAHTEALSYRDQDVFVVGGANSAAQGALYLSRFAGKVTVLVRGPHPTASVYLVEAIQQNPKIDLLVHTDLVSVSGQKHLESIVVRNSVLDESRSLAGRAMFVFIGVRPQSDFVADLVLRDPKGYIYTGPDLPQAPGGRPKGWPLERAPLLLETSVPGVFAAGDVRFGTNHRVASATGEGGIAVAMIREYMRAR